jgi:hypothetical protein
LKEIGFEPVVSVFDWLEMVSNLNQYLPNCSSLMAGGPVVAR